MEEYKQWKYFLNWGPNEFSRDPLKLPPVGFRGLALKTPLNSVDVELSTRILLGLSLQC